MKMHFLGVILCSAHYVHSIFAQLEKALETLLDNTYYFRNLPYCSSLLLMLKKWRFLYAYCTHVFMHKSLQDSSKGRDKNYLNYSHDFTVYNGLKRKRLSIEWSRV